MTQALALARMLRVAGHRVVKVFVGTSHVRSVPRYFAEGVGAPLDTFTAPTLVPAHDQRAVSVGATALNSTLRLPAYVAAGVRLARALRPDEVDVVVNFYDLVGALSRVVLGATIPSVALAHNYWFLHRAAAVPPGSPLSRGAFATLSRASLLRSDVRLALAFGPGPVDADLGLRVAPPLLRAPLGDRPATRGDYLLAYAVNPGYANDLATWHRDKRRPMEVHCFVEGGSRALRVPAATGLHVHDLDGNAFLERMAGCRAYVGSAGFESLCEAFWFGKPALAIPTDGQPEQVLNAWDAERHGVARTGSWDGLDDFLADPPVPDADAVRAFRTWTAEAPRHHVAAVEEAAYTPRS
jgi:UDP:flavonoid glycosyltransferase YjiC (YdhE family)